MTEQITFTLAQVEEISRMIAGAVASAKQEAAPATSGVDAILAMADDLFGLPKGAGRRRTAEVCYARNAVYLALRRKGHSLPSIGRLMDRDHTSVIHGISVAEKAEAGSAWYAEAVASLEGRTAPPEPITTDKRTPKSSKEWQRLLALADDLRSEYGSGASLHETAVKFSSNVVAVRKALVMIGVEIRSAGNPRPRPVNDRIERIMELRSQGSTLEEIGADLGITRERVRQLVLNAGMKEQFAERPFKPNELEAIEDYKRGGSLHLCATKAGYGQAHFKNMLTRAGVLLRPTNRQIGLRARAEKVAELYNAGVCPAEIARRFGFKAETYVYRELGKAGVRANRGHRA